MKSSKKDTKQKKKSSKEILQAQSGLFSLSMA